jgi:hypothetical protein
VKDIAKKTLLVLIDCLARIAKAEGRKGGASEGMAISNRKGSSEGITHGEEDMGIEITWK